MLARRDIPLIEDDVYGELVFDGTRPRPLRAFDTDEAHVLLCGSVSKTLAPGYRVGWVAPGRYHDAVEQLKFAHIARVPDAARRWRSPSSSPRAATIATCAGCAASSPRSRRALPRGDRAALSRRHARVAPAGWLRRVGRAAERRAASASTPSSSSCARSTRASRSRPARSSRRASASGNCIRISTGHPWSPRIERAIATLGQLARE